MSVTKLTITISVDRTYGWTMPNVSCGWRIETEFWWAVWFYTWKPMKEEEEDTNISVGSCWILGGGRSWFMRAYWGEGNMYSTYRHPAKILTSLRSVILAASDAHALLWRINGRLGVEGFFKFQCFVKTRDVRNTWRELFSARLSE